MQETQNKETTTELKMKNSSKISLSSIRRALGLFLLIFIFFGSGYYLGVNGYQAKVDDLTRVEISRENPPEKQDLDFALFWRIWDTLEVKYYDTDKLDDTKMVYGAIRGMVSAIEDPYTVFLPPSQNKVVQEDLQGNFSGVGIRIEFKGQQLTVAAPLPGTPAEQAGVLAGDYILGIKDMNKGINMGTNGISLQEAVEASRGVEGSKVTLTLVREGVNDPFEAEIERRPIAIPAIAIEYVGENNDIAHVQIIKFSGEMYSEWNQTVEAILTNPNVSRVIMDVRNNPGGYMAGAIELASDFLEQGDVVVIEEQRGKPPVESIVQRLNRLGNVEVVVLINKGSASSSEIFAGALRDNRGITLIGENTFGKGTIQEPQQLENGIGLHVTIAKWLTPSGYWVNEVGLEPDILVINDPETVEDEQLLSAIEFLDRL